MLEQLKPNVPHAIRERGETYWRDGAVTVTEGNAETVVASVFGTDEYEVGLYWDPTYDALEVLCNCPYFTDRVDPCKHIWATLIEAQVEGHLAATHGVEDVRLEPVHEPPFAVPDPNDELAEGLIEPAVSTWRAQLAEVERAEPSLRPAQRAWLGERRIFYRLDVEASKRNGNITVEFCCRDRKKNGDWGAIKSVALQQETISHLPDPADRRLLSTVVGAREAFGNSGWYGGYSPLPKRFVLPPGVLVDWVRTAAETGRMIAPGGDSTKTISWDSGLPWQMGLEIRNGNDEFQLNGFLTREEQRVALSEPILLSVAGLVFFERSVAQLDEGGAFSWIPVLRRHGSVRVPTRNGNELVEKLLALPQAPILELPAELQYEEVPGEPRPDLTVRRTSDWWLERGHLLEVVLRFDYDGESVDWQDPRTGIYCPHDNRLLKRDRSAETAASERLRELGVREEAAQQNNETQRLVVPERRLAQIVYELTADGWHVEAEGQLFRRAMKFDLQITSGLDWFDLEGKADFGEQTVELPQLLRAFKRGERTVLLDDGSRGVLPEEWLEQYGLLAGMADTNGEHLRFQSNQIGLLDALLAARPEITFDEAVGRARRQLSDFDGVEAIDEPSTFRGELRGYQKEGLGWLMFLRRFGFGGCLADDMGLGKTVQVLALLESRRQEKLHQEEDGTASKQPAPALVIVPKSLIFNWSSEAARFTPELRVLDHTGPQRKQNADRLDEYDIVLTTYGTLRRDIAWLEQRTFDYVVLDEAQAIKNHNSATAKASRLLRARNRLALTGTPIENHVGELMSILDFLNPGLFGPGRALKVPKAVRDGALGDDTDDAQLALLVGAVRPFILRRTKQQVAKDLPEKHQQTLFCDLPPQQRKEYDQLRRHYQRALLNRIDENGISRSKMHVLEALLRLRQAACHPGLIDRDRSEDVSGKLEVLLPQLDEIIEKGNKSLVFSQFTSMLAIVRSHLDARGVQYEYLDGKTRNRQECIERFQDDPGCSVFLISLKAGGVGLNLTAAEYVFLLDPWWNPAVEAQAIDRTHRIGQTKTVFAYSLIARDTVEEKVLELQQSKRKLADAIVRADSSLLRSLTRDDLAQLLS